jgi:hypothetical protein
MSAGAMARDIAVVVASAGCVWLRPGVVLDTCTHARDPLFVVPPRSALRVSAGASCAPPRTNVM